MRFEYSDMDAYEFLMNLVRNSNLITISQYFKHANDVKYKYEAYKRNQRAVESIRENEGDLIAGIIGSAFGHKDLDEKTEDKVKEAYLHAIADWKNLSEEPDIIDEIWEKLDNLLIEYIEAVKKAIKEAEQENNKQEHEATEGKDSKKDIYEYIDPYLRAELITSTASILSLQQVRMYYENETEDKQEEEEENPWKSIKVKIAEMLDAMSAEDFMITVEMAGMSAVFKNQEFAECFARKLQHAKATEFLRMSINTTDGMDGRSKEVSNIKKQKFQGLLKSGLGLNILDTAHASLIDFEDVSEFLEDVPQYDIVKILLTPGVFEDLKYEEQITALYSRLTQTQLLRYMIQCKGVYGNRLDTPEQLEIIKSKLSELSNEDLKLLVQMYISSSGTQRIGESGLLKIETVIEEIAENKDDLEDVEEVKPITTIKSSDEKQRELVFALAIERGIINDTTRERTKTVYKPFTDEIIGEKTVKQRVLSLSISEQELEELKQREWVYKRAGSGEYNLPMFQCNIR